MPACPAIYLWDLILKILSFQNAPHVIDPRSALRPPNNIGLRLRNLSQFNPFSDKRLMPSVGAQTPIPVPPAMFSRMTYLLSPFKMPG
jgi:hypothetical protein